MPDTSLPARERIVEGAREAFSIKGFHSTTTRDIAAAAGMSPAAVYVHHRSKEELLYAISLAGHRATVQSLRKARASARDPVGQLSAMVHAFVTGHTTAHTTARVVNYELAALQRQHRAVIDGLRHDVQRIFREVLGAGVAAGEFDCPDIGMTTNTIVGMSVDVARWYADDGAWSPERIARHYAQMALRSAGYRGPAAANGYRPGG